MKIHTREKMAYLHSGGVTIQHRPSDPSFGNYVLLRRIRSSISLTDVTGVAPVGVGTAGNLTSWPVRKKRGVPWLLMSARNRVSYVAVSALVLKAYIRGHLEQLFTKQGILGSAERTFVRSGRVDVHLPLGRTHSILVVERCGISAPLPPDS